MLAYPVYLHKAIYHFKKTQQSLKTDLPRRPRK